MGLIISDCVNPCKCGGQPYPPSGSGLRQLWVLSGGGSGRAKGYSFVKSGGQFYSSAPGQNVLTPVWSASGQAYENWYRTDYLQSPPVIQNYTTYPQTCYAFYSNSSGTSLKVGGFNDGSGSISFSFSGIPVGIGGNLSISVFVDDWTEVPPPGEYNSLTNPGGWNPYGVAVIVSFPSAIGSTVGDIL
jgi:hypothetical protein